MRLKIKGHKKETLQDSFRNFDKYHGIDYQKPNSKVGKYYKWQKILDKQKLLEAIKSQPVFNMNLEKVSPDQKKNQLPERIFVMKAPFFVNPKERAISTITEEKLFESQIVNGSELPSELRDIMDIPLSEEVDYIKKDSVALVESSKIIEEEPLVESPSEPERVISINLNETLDKIAIERPSLSEKQMVPEETESIQKLSKSQPIIINPYIESAKRLDEMSRSIQQRVQNLNEKLSVTKNSISKMKEARTNSAKSTPVSLPGESLMRFDFNALGKQSWFLKREDTLAPFSSDMSKENLGDSRNVFAKPSCQKSGYCSSSKASAKKTPLPLKEYIESQSSAEKACSCKEGKTSESFKAEQHHGERSNEKKKMMDQSSWLSESGIQIRLNKAEVLRMEYIRKKSQTPTKMNIVENYCALSNEKRGSEAKTKLEEL